MKCWEYWKCEQKNRCKVVPLGWDDGKCWLLGKDCPRRAALAKEKAEVEGCFACAYFQEYGKAKIKDLGAPPPDAE